jgi:hypothetical protein
MRIALTVAVLSTATLVLAACGGDLPTPTPAQPAATPTSAPEATATPTTVPAAATATPTLVPTATPTLVPSSTPTVVTPAPTLIPVLATATPGPISLVPTATPTPRLPATPTPAPVAVPGAPVTLTLTAVADATIWGGAGSTANGAGTNLYAGTNNQGQERRVLMLFDLSEIPAGATVSSAAVGVTINKVPPSAAAPTYGLHRVSASWGEGASTSGGRGGSAAVNDVTWTKRFTGGDSWSTQGGDFVASASAQSGGEDWATTAGLMADVQAWVDDAAANFGWIIVETTGANKSVRRLSSREGTAGPTLSVTFSTN